MGVESSTERRNSDELAAIQNRLGSEQVASVDTLDDEIKTVIDESSRLQRFEYVIGTVDDAWIHNDHRHFDLIDPDEDGQIHCVIFDSRRASITTEITEGRQVAVAGDVSFFPPKGKGSILVKEVAPLKADDSQRRGSALPVDRQQLLLLAVGLVIVLGLVGFFLL